jgi:hypothetical protein
MRRRGELRIGSMLRAEPAAVWERAMSAAGINAELGPLLRMTTPRGRESLDLHALEPGPLGPRLPLPGRLLRPPVAAVFRHRHQQLRRHFGGVPLPRR